MKGTWVKKLYKVWAFESTKICGFGGSVVCDRIVRLVLGDVGFGRRLWAEEDEEKEKFKRARGQWI